MRRIQRNHKKSGGQKILVQKQLLGTKASTSKDFQRECLFSFDGALLKDTELPGDTREAHQAGIALGGAYILCLHCQFVIQVLSLKQLLLELSCSTDIFMIITSVGKELISIQRL